MVATDNSASLTDVQVLQDGETHPEARAATQRKVWIIGLFALVALVIACYAFAMNSYWAGDDYNYVRPKDWSAVLNFFNPVGRAQFRPLTWSTWALDYTMFGVDPLGWHLTRLLQHIWNAVMVAALLRAITGRAEIALLAAALFALHPAQPQTVTWLGGQADASFAMLWLPALLLFVLWRKGAGKGSGRWLWAAAGVLGFVSMFGKEAAVTLPVMSLWIDLLFGREWARWPGRRDKGWWRDRTTLLRLLGDHSLFIAASAAYSGMRLVLFFTGQGRLMYGAHQFAILETPLSVATGYLTVAAGFWQETVSVYAWSLLPKLAVLLGTLLVVGLLVRWLGKIAIFAVGWFLITIMLTLEGVQLRWFYLPAVGVGILVAAVWVRLRDDLSPTTTQKAISGWRTWRGALTLGPLLFVAWFGWQTVRHNEQWQESGEIARSILTQVKQLHSAPTLPATFYITGPPYSYKDVLLFNTGLDAAMSLAYNNWSDIQGYSLAEDFAHVNAALADPSQIGPNPIFLRYNDGKIVEYPSLQELNNAGK